MGYLHYLLSLHSLAAERCGLMRMTTVRATLIRNLTETLGCDRYHLYTGHPSLRQERQAADGEGET